MNKKEQKQFEKQLKTDVVKYLCNNRIDLNNVKEINKALKTFDHKYYTEIKYKLKCNKDMQIEIIYDKEMNIK